MGQRLNLEITIGENVLANAYYHWSGYTTSSLKLVESALKKIRRRKKICFRPIRISIRYA